MKGYFGTLLLIELRLDRIDLLCTVKKNSNHFSFCVKVFPF